jgi:hypothetical protein
MAIARGRWTHDRTATGEDMVVFLIGMHVNKPWRPDQWLPTAMAMGPMLAELSRDPDLGLLGFRTLLGSRGPTVVQYWRDTESLYRYASATERRHRPAWAAFNRRARKVPGTVGIWHETYRIRAAESVYVDMPPLGLAKAVGARPVPARLDRARDRLAG